MESFTTLRGKDIAILMLIKKANNRIFLYQINIPTENYGKNCGLGSSIIKLPVAWFAFSESDSSFEGDKIELGVVELGACVWVVSPFTSPASSSDFSRTATFSARICVWFFSPLTRLWH